MPPCKKCGEEIVFVETPRGTFIPCDPELLTIVLLPGVVAVTEQGTVMRGTEFTKNTSVQGYVNHWSTCPFAEEFRKGRR